MRRQFSSIRLSRFSIFSDEVNFNPNHRLGKCRRTGVEKRTNENRQKSEGKEDCPKSIELQPSVSTVSRLAGVTSFRPIARTLHQRVSGCGFGTGTISISPCICGLCAMR